MTHNIALITCDNTHQPVGLFMPLNTHYIQHQHTQAQLQATEPLKKQLWAQTVAAKIKSQHTLLAKNNLPTGTLKTLYANVLSADTDNKEAQAAAHYWKHIFVHIPTYQHQKFARDRHGAPPNHLLNYAYALLRAATARALVSAGLLPIAGIHHHNQYNAYPLADDIMEPYRTYADQCVLQIITTTPQTLQNHDLTPEIKQQLLKTLHTDVLINNQTKPLIQALHTTAASLVKCYLLQSKKIIYPDQNP
jgi:CRISPR-associated protein Cas1